MNTPSRTLVNWIALGLIILFVWILLATIIVPRLRPASSAAGDVDVTVTSPNADATTTALYAPTPTAIYWALPAGALITTEQVGSIPAGERVQVMHASYTPDGWVYSVSTLDNALMADAREDQLSLDANFDPASVPARPLYQDSAYWSECYPLVLTEDIPVDPPQPDQTFIAAGTRVRIASYFDTARYVEGHGYVYVYSVTTQPDTSADWSSSSYAPIGLGGMAYEYQLAVAEGVSITEGQPTPDSPFEIGVYGAAFILTEDIGKLRAGTRVSIGSAHYGCDAWIYDIYTEQGRTAQARHDQLAYDPSFTPGPTPTYPVTAIPTLPVTWTPTPTREGVPVPDERFVAISGLYGCSGTENGLGAGAGQLAIAENGFFEYYDYYPGDPIQGTLAWISETELDVVEDLNILSITVIDDKTISVAVVEGSLTHTDEGRLACTNMSKQ